MPESRVNYTRCAPWSEVHERTYVTWFVVTAMDRGVVGVRAADDCEEAGATHRKSEYDSGPQPQKSKVSQSEVGNVSRAFQPGSSTL